MNTLQCIQPIQAAIAIENLNFLYIRKGEFVKELIHFIAQKDTESWQTFTIEEFVIYRNRSFSLTEERFFTEILEQVDPEITMRTQYLKCIGIIESAGDGWFKVNMDFISYMSEEIMEYS